MKQNKSLVSIHRVDDRKSGILDLAATLAAAITIAIVAGFVSGIQFARADQAVAASYVPGAELAGKARYRYLVWPVFDAQLYAPGGRFNPGKPFALTLTYLRPLKGSDIAQYSADEMRNQGFADGTALRRWQTQMSSIFPDVTKGSQITGVRDMNGNAIFFANGREIGSIRDARFSRHFFDIWLGSRASDPSFRRSLTGS